jgi:outer membrane protein assembly factor BamD
MLSGLIQFNTSEPMMKRLFLFSLCLPLFLLMAGCGPTKIPDPYANYRSLSAQQIFENGEKLAAKKDYDKASKAFLALEALYPDTSKYREQGLVDSVYTNFMADEPDLATAQCQRYLMFYPNGRNLDYIYYMLGRIQYEKALSFLQLKLKVDPALVNDLAYTTAFTYFQKLIDIDPHSKYADDAVYRMRYLRDLFARHQLIIAQYYFDRGAYLAAANRAVGIVLHYNGTHAAAPALKVLNLSYQRLGLTSKSHAIAAAMAAHHTSS